MATVRQMMQTLLSRMDALQQNQAIQLAGVHDRMDAVELELPLIQEQSALRMRDLEARVSVEIDHATRSAEAIHEEVADKFHSLAAQMESQRHELSQMRESKKLSETRLNQAILDIERLCGTVAERPTASAYRSRISEHIRQAALDLAPAAPPSPARVPVPAVAALVSEPGVNHTENLKSPPVPATPLVNKAPAGSPVPGYDSWKRQFMQNGDPDLPADGVETNAGNPIVVCPRCYSDRTRPATPNRWDQLYRLARLFPHRCRSCSHRFYKRVGPSQLAPEDRPAEVMETR